MNSAAEYRPRTGVISAVAYKQLSKPFRVGMRI
jgi:hypothetical protein